jgi:hypothetical protein
VYGSLPELQQRLRLALELPPPKHWSYQVPRTIQVTFNELFPLGRKS